MLNGFQCHPLPGNGAGLRMADFIGADLVPGIGRLRIDIAAFVLKSFYDEIQGLLEVFIVFFMGEDILLFEPGNDTLGEFSPVFFGNGEIWIKIQQGDVSGGAVDTLGLEERKALPSTVV